MTEYLGNFSLFHGYIIRPATLQEVKEKISVLNRKKMKIFESGSFMGTLSLLMPKLCFLLE